MKLLQIVPGFGKVDNAIFQYATILSEELGKYNIFTTFDLAEIDNCDAIYLNYVGYGYEKRGVPISFYFRIKRLLKKHPIKLFIFFHELYAEGNKYTTSSFWLSPIQKLICFRLLKLSTASFCSNEIMFNSLTKNTSGKRIYNIGLFSNIKPLKVNRKLSDRENIAVVFGGYERRKAVYKNSELFSKFCLSCQIDKVIDIGNGDIKKDFPGINIQIVVKGILTNEEIASILQNSTYGLIDYSEQFLAKSGIFAAYAGNGMVVINFSDKKIGLRDKLNTSMLYQPASEMTSNDRSSLQQKANQLFNWYQSHTKEDHALLVYNVINNKSCIPENSN